MKILKNKQELLSQQDQIEQVAGYIQNLSERVEKLKGRKEQIMPNNKISKRSAAATTTVRSANSLPILKIRDLGSSFEVVVIIGLTKNFGLNRVVRVLEEEGAEVLALSMSNMGHKIFHTLHAQVFSQHVPRLVFYFNLVFYFISKVYVHCEMRNVIYRILIEFSCRYIVV